MTIEPGATARTHQIDLGLASIPRVSTGEITQKGGSGEVKEGGL